jgi:hypothetical protein
MFPAEKYPQEVVTRTILYIAVYRVKDNVCCREYHTTDHTYAAQFIKTDREALHSLRVCNIISEREV